MSYVIYNSNSIFTSNLTTQTSKDFFTFNNHIFINGNVGIGTYQPLYNFHIENVTFNQTIKITNEQNIYSSTYNQYYGLLPIGSIILIPSQRLVSLLLNNGWLECNGTTYNQSNYPLLEPLLRNANYGNGTGFNSTFKLPDFRNRIPVGAGGSYSQTYYNTNSSQTVTISVNHLPPHSHSGNTQNPSNLGSHSHYANSTSTGNNNAMTTNNCCGGWVTNSVYGTSTSDMLGVDINNHTHNHGASWGHYNNTTQKSINLERNKMYMIYMIKAR